MVKDRYDSIPGFSSIGPGIWEYARHTPTQLSGKSEEQCPDLIFIFSWTGAGGRHILKYTQNYQILFPSSRILVVTTSIKDMALRTSKRRQRRLRPAIDHILQYKANDILIHAFSEGGTNKAVEFAEAYYNETGQRLPATTVCIDSAPGKPRFMPLVNAVRKSLPPHPILRFGGLAISWIWFSLVWAIYIINGGKKTSPIAKTRRRLLDDRLWDFEAPRCYLYSRADDLIMWPDIQEHAIESREKGIPVTEAFFEKSAHCRHMADDPAMYWDAVIATWRQSKRCLQEKSTPSSSLKHERSTDTLRSAADSERTLTG
ncbi:hypothetical protein BU24DRAFT_428065 [Aaosphaeria arxii CBS 175.79]|uniref:DUF829-domain-containing protein n=1 Tax=Aaosphaeria arxii CBS 175.79 TaxID=1450172 RepID=A0A6A5XAR8_9PLEO|nr:uncharacterized protein BU24DRAFT_428065 [Aaosphaeria arxii CBS 175.79]KAF2010031.1 hypothetical protein BU24DRAFT_428065 [Aaosphaeria arxii CBS 175.79]